MTNDDKVPEATICAKCVNMMLGTPDHPGIPQCKANPRLDYVTGKLDCLLCIAKNKGTCPDYAAAPVPPDAQADEAWGSSENDRGVE